MGETYEKSIDFGCRKRYKNENETPKCAYPILNKPMILYQIEALERANVDQIIVVVGYKSDLLKKSLGSRVIYVYQDEVLGTAHSALQAKDIT